MVPPGVSDRDFIRGGSTSRLVSLGDRNSLKHVMDKEDKYS